MSEKARKIGCVIAYGENHNNYGTSLQGYATLKKIRDLGYECEVIRYKKRLSAIEKLRLVVLMFLCGGTSVKMRVVKERINLALHKDFARNISVRTKAVNRYKVRKLIPLFREYDGFEALSRGSLNYGVVLVGSDQVWSPMSLYSKYFNLLFVDDTVPKISYASSFGVSQIPSIQIEETREYLNRLDRIGVRELKGKEIVEAVSDKKATVVADPTLLLTREEWEKEIEGSTANTEEPYIFCYLLGANPEARKAVNDLKQRTGLKVIAIRHLDEYVKADEKFGDEAPYDVSPNDFVRYISRAEYVCTDSFHGTVFSILFNRKFVTFYRFKPGSRHSRNSRIDSLLELLGLQDRLDRGVIFDQMEEVIDYENVNEKLNSFRTDSLTFLKESLELAGSAMGDRSE